LVIGEATTTNGGGAGALLREGGRRLTSNHLAAHLRREVMSGKYLSNERLPPERSIARNYAVSRGTVRDALTQLVDLGIVERRAGSGTYVTYSDADTAFSIIHSTSPLELIDTRLALEPQIIRLAVLHATANTISIAESALITMENCGGDAAEFSSADADFHQALAQCTQNSLLIWMTERVNEVRNQLQWTKMRELTLTREVIRSYNQQHRSVFEGIRRRQADVAARVMREHLETARRTLVSRSV
jgi:DNA-binding FadR family transcriptional regulator